MHGMERGFNQRPRVFQIVFTNWAIWTHGFKPTVAFKQFQIKGYNPAFRR